MELGVSEENGNKWGKKIWKKYTKIYMLEANRNPGKNSLLEEWSKSRREFTKIENITSERILKIGKYIGKNRIEMVKMAKKRRFVEELNLLKRNL